MVVPKLSCPTRALLRYSITPIGAGAGIGGPQFTSMKDRKRYNKS